MNSKILFLTLYTHNATGGIETMNRVIHTMLQQQLEENFTPYCLLSLYDSGNGNKNYKTFNGNKWAFSKQAILESRHFDTLLLSHINLLPFAWAIKKINPSVRLRLFLHGIEAWQVFSGYRKKLLKICDSFIAVSNFTRDKFLYLNKDINKEVFVLNHCINPALKREVSIKNKALRERLGFTEQDVVLLSVTRMSEKDRQKGYDKVIKALGNILDERVKYLIAGTYTSEEEKYLKRIMSENNVAHRVKMTSYVEPEDLPEYFSVSDVYILPSIKEGFGISYIEAMHYGLPVVAGNKDGSVDALRNGDFGVLVDPDNLTEIAEKIKMILGDMDLYRKKSTLGCSYFNFDTYRNNFTQLMNGS